MNRFLSASLSKKLSALLSQKSLSAYSHRKDTGFTLIELLVVIGILGILASALVATIDPFQQLKKASDANLKNIAVEYINGNIRYYTTHNKLPWADTTVANCNTGNPIVSEVSLGDASMAGCMDALVSDGELKKGFTTVSALTDIYISGDSTSVTACFLPTSQSQQKDANAKFTRGGALAPANSCLSQTSGNGITACYWCSQ